MWEIGRDDKGRERRKEEKRKEERSERGREGELRAVWEGLRQGGEGKRAGMGGRRGWGKLPTAVMQLEVFLPDSRLTARVGRGRAGLHPLPPRYFRGKGMGAGPRNTKVEGGGPGSGSFPRGPDGGPFALTGKTERGSQRLGRLLPSDFLFSLLFPVFLVECLLIKGSFIYLCSMWSLPLTPFQSTARKHRLRSEPFWSGTAGHFAYVLLDVLHVTARFQSFRPLFFP